MRNQDLAGRNGAAGAKKSPALLSPSARPVLGRGGREVLALVMATAWGQPCCWWPLSILGSPITFPSPPTPPNAGFKGLQGGARTSDRLCQSIFFGDLMVTSLPGDGLCLEHLLPTLLPAAPEELAAIPSIRKQRRGLTTLSCPTEQWLWAAGPHPHPTLQSLRGSRLWCRRGGGTVLPRDRSRPDRGTREAKL